MVNMNSRHEIAAQKLKDKIKTIRERLKSPSYVDIFPGWQVRIYSEILEESFILYEDGRVVFDSSVEYTEDEWRKLVGLSTKELRAVHNTKSVFPQSEVKS